MEGNAQKKLKAATSANFCKKENRLHKILFRGRLKGVKKGSVDVCFSVEQKNVGDAKNGELAFVKNFETHEI